LRALIVAILRVPVRLSNRVNIPRRGYFTNGYM
jgi:hypothetical protein